MKFFSDFVNRFGVKNLIILAVIVLLLVLGVIFLINGNTGIGSNPLLQNKPATTKVILPTAIPKPTTIPGETIMLTFTRPVPKSLTIKKGHLVNFANFSGAKVEIKGADDKSLDLNVGILEDNNTSSMINLKETGTYRYIDKLNPKIAGEIIVQ